MGTCLQELLMSLDRWNQAGSKMSMKSSWIIFQLCVLCTFLNFTIGCFRGLGTFQGIEGRSVDMRFSVDEFRDESNILPIVIKNESNYTLLSVIIENDDVIIKEKSARVSLSHWAAKLLSLLFRSRRGRLEFSLEDLSIQDTGKYSLYVGDSEQQCLHLFVVVPLRNVTVHHTIMDPSKILTATEVPEYGQAEFTCTTSPSSTPALITWYIEHPPYDVNSSLELTTPKRRARINAGYKDLLFVTEEETTVTFNKNMSRARISCQANSGGKTVTTYTHPFTVVYSPVAADIAQPRLLGVNDRLDLSCDADGVPEPTVSWREGNLAAQRQPTAEPSSHTLTLMNVQCEDMGNYICVAENKMGIDTKSVEVLIKCPPRENPNAPHVPIQYSHLNSPVNLIIHVLSYRLPTFRWMIKGSDGTLESITGRTVTQTDLGRSSKLSIEKLEKFGTYVVQVSNGIFPDAEFEFNIIRLSTEEQASKLASQSETMPATSLVSIVIVQACIIVCGVVLAVLFRFKDKLCRKTVRESEYASTNPGLVDEHLYAEATRGVGDMDMQPTAPPLEHNDSEQEMYQNV